MTILARPSEWIRSRKDATSATAFAEGRHHYFAFISYSHRDEEIADWLQEELETFRVPANLVGRITEHGAIPRRLTPIFRDLEELPASDNLGTEIRAALNASRYLIVLCSPESARSRWANAEIEEFKRARPDGCILAAIVAGEPFASDIPGREQEECLPRSLRYKYDRRGRVTDKRAEPLAADLREGGEARRLGLLKLIAGLLDVGLDELVRRDTVRRQRRLAILATASLAGMVVTSGLALTAIQARDAARDQRREAEGLVAFMLGDLRSKLEPVGRLDVLDSVGSKALAYYKKQDPSELSDEALAQRSRALTLLGQVASERGDLGSALGFYRAAFQGSMEALRRSPDDAQRIYDHAQNVFYIGDVARSRGDMRQAEAQMREYKRLAQRLVAIDRTNPTWQMEGIYADSSLGVLLNDQGRYAEAAGVFANALADRERLVAAYPANEQYRKALIEMLAWLSEARENQGRLDEGLSLRERQLTMLLPLLAAQNPDSEYERQALVAYRAAGRLNAVTGNLATGVDQLRRSVEIGDALSRAEPANSTWASSTALARLDLARLELAQKNFDRAATAVRQACDTAGQLVAKDPSVVSWRFNVRGECLEGQIRIALARSSTAEAREYSDALLRLAREERNAPPGQAQLAAANAFFLRGLVERAAGNSAQMRRALQLAWTSWPGAVADRPPLLARKSLILEGLGKRQEAQSLARRLEEMGYREPVYLRDARTLQ